MTSQKLHLKACQPVSLALLLLSAVAVGKAAGIMDEKGGEPQLKTCISQQEACIDGGSLVACAMRTPGKPPGLPVDLANGVNHRAVVA